MTPGKPRPKKRRNFLSIFAVLFGIFVISIFARPWSHYRFLKLREDGGDLRRMISRKAHALFARKPKGNHTFAKKKATTDNGKEETSDSVMIREIDSNVELENNRSSETTLNSLLLSNKSQIGNEKKGIHVMVTSNGLPYMNWQTRIMYFTYLQVANKPGSDFKHFTRVLHRTKDDAIMDDIPTLRVEPLDPKCDNWCEYPVASRPWAIQQWLESGDVKGDWIFMIETDYVFVKPMSIPASGNAIGFPFNYIVPKEEKFSPLVQKYYSEGNAADIPSTGNAPVLAPTAYLKKVVPIWVNLTAEFEKDDEAKKQFGWVREMYSFSFAIAKANLSIYLPDSPHAIMSQPPANDGIGDAVVLHYTWGNQIKDDNGTVIWEFEKRKHGDRGLPDRIPDPPQGKKLTEAQSVLVSKVNEAISNLPKYTKGEAIELEGSSRRRSR